MKARANTSPRIGAAKRRHAQRSGKLNLNRRIPGNQPGSRFRKAMRDIFNATQPRIERKEAAEVAKKRGFAGVMTRIFHGFFGRRGK